MKSGFCYDFTLLLCLLYNYNLMIVVTLQIPGSIMQRLTIVLVKYIFESLYLSFQNFGAIILSTCSSLYDNIFKYLKMKKKKFKFNFVVRFSLIFYFYNYY